MADDDRIARALAGVTNVLRMPSRVARSMVEGFDDLVERAKTESTSAALGGDFNPQPGMELATGAIGGGVPFAVRGAVGSAGGKVIQPPGIRAYHGSPHDFDRFDMSKIGTGEGAQAYGHGLYFAEREGTARSYRDALSNDQLRFASELAPLLPKQYQGSRDAGRRIVSDIQEALASGDIKKATEYLSTYDVGTDLAPAYRRAGELIEGGGGRMYEVNIRAQPEQFLDWDKPLAGQPQTVQQIMEAKQGQPIIGGSDLSGPSLGQAYMGVGGNLGRRAGSRGAGAVELSEALRDAGVPGIRYLDQGSRAGGEGTSNYVLFRDDIIDILRKYGIAVPPTGAALANQGRVADALAQEPLQ